MKTFQPSPALRALLAQFDAIARRPMPAMANSGREIDNLPPPLPAAPALTDPLERAFYQQAILPAYQRIQARVSRMATTAAQAAPAPSSQYDYSVGSTGSAP